jgi:regulator of replication initiation timing
MMTRSEEMKKEIQELKKELHELKKEKAKLQFENEEVKKRIKAFIQLMDDDDKKV